MTIVHYRPDGMGRHDFWFEFDAQVVALIKTIPVHERSYDPLSRIWTVDDFQVRALVSLLESYGHRTVLEPMTDRAQQERDWQQEQQAKDRARRQHEREEEARRQQREREREQWEDSRREWREQWDRAWQRADSGHTAPGGAAIEDWAEQLLRAVGPERVDAVFKALTRVLHPDVKTGDETLMKALNNARDRHR